MYVQTASIVFCILNAFQIAAFLHEYELEEKKLIKINVYLMTFLT